MIYRDPEMGGERVEGASLPLFEQAHARKSDPQTSKDAGRSVVNLGRTRDAIVKILANYGPSTDERIALIYRGLIGIGSDIPQSSPSGLRSRRAELVRMGFVEAGGTGKTASGRACTIWKLASGAGESSLGMERAR